MFEKLDDKNFEIYAARNYTNPRCLTIEDFQEDVLKFKYVVRLLNKYEKSGMINERLVLNHLILLYSVFETNAVNRILFYKIKEPLWPALKAFMIYLNRVPEDRYMNVTVDLKIVKKLQEL
jgi:hypothetical protein